MSYILDALRRADAERERGRMPGLHSHEAAPTPRGERTSALQAGLIGLGAGTVLVLGAMWIWRQGSGRESTAPAPTSVVAAAPGAGSIASAGALPTPPSERPLGSSATPAPTVTGSVAPVPAASPLPVPSATAPAPVASLSSKPRQVAVPRVGASGAAADPAHTPPVATSPSLNAEASSNAPVEATSASARLYRSDELPEDVRRQLPVLSVGGSAYSASAASRFVIVNGQLFHEGDTLSPGLTLEQIRLRSAVLAFKGYRYGISF